MLADTKSIPCVVFAFNRPDKLNLILAALKKQKIDNLILFVDGPRNKLDEEKVEQCKLIAEKVDWVKKELYFNQQNAGLNGLIGNINTVFSRHQSAIFVEDDCLPMPAFYSFMCETLAHYKTEQNVFSIGGYQPLGKEYFRNYPYSMIATWRFYCWGWATWQNRWASISPYISKFNELFDNLQNIPDIVGHDLKTTAQAVAQGKAASWDVKVAIASLWLKKAHLLPVKGMIQNIGFDVSGVHSGKEFSVFHNKNVYSDGEIKNIVWLKDMKPQKYYVKKIKQFIIKATQPSVFKRLLWLFRKTLGFVKYFR